MQFMFLVATSSLEALILTKRKHKKIGTHEDSIILWHQHFSYVVDEIDFSLKDIHVHAVPGRSHNGYL